MLNLSVVDLLPVVQILGEKFYVPFYQRGYRWTSQQVEDFLSDISLFAWQRINRPEEADNFYCIQPLVCVVCEDPTKKEYYEVVDGQQRLTTIYILASYCKASGNNQPFTLEYQTRKGSQKFLEGLFSDSTHNENEDSNLDYYHMFNTKRVIQNWFEKGRGRQILSEKFVDINVVKRVMLESVKFIWYCPKSDDKIGVFTRLNVGKIPLTNSELIRALILKKEAEDTNLFDTRTTAVAQTVISREWDEIETTLKDDQFWLFIHSKDYDKPTRIEYIFDIVCERDELHLGSKVSLGDDAYRTFRYFAEALKVYDPSVCWNRIKQIFQAFKEWHCDLKFYHYVGYLIEMGVGINKLLDAWENPPAGFVGRSGFLSELRRLIKAQIKECCNLSQQYEMPGYPAKRSARPLLLLYNIQTAIRHGEDLKGNPKYKLPIFYKFPFHLYKREKWDVEHIDSNTRNGLESIEDQKDWIRAAYLSFWKLEKNAKREEVTREMLRFLKSKTGAEFWTLHKKICSTLGIDETDSSLLSKDDRNKIWNFVLLDAGTNRGYGNSVFASKRMCIIGKDVGRCYSVNDDLSVDIQEGKAVAFVPPCTLKAFMKGYTPALENLREWDIVDADCYKEELYSALKEFDVIK